jgi:hypothetical protein
MRLQVPRLFPPAPARIPFAFRPAPFCPLLLLFWMLLLLLANHPRNIYTLRVRLSLHVCTEIITPPTHCAPASAGAFSDAVYCCWNKRL